MVYILHLRMEVHVSPSFKLTAFGQEFYRNSSVTYILLFALVLPQLALPPLHFPLNPDEKKREKEKESDISKIS